MKKNDFIRGISIVALLFVLAMSLVFAAPVGPTGPQNITELSDSRFNATAYGGQTVWAEAGNISRLSIFGLSPTKSWQGYYGDITGVITLDDAEGYTLYDWYSAEPQGEIYAATATVSDWSTVHCFNYTNDGASHSYLFDGGAYYTTTTTVLNLTELEVSLGIGQGDFDGVDMTFNATGTIVTLKDYLTGELTYEQHDQFFVGTVNISEGSCPSTNTYETHCMNKTSSTPTDWARIDTGYCDDPANPQYAWEGTLEGNNFQEVLLTINDSETLIYTTIIENNQLDNLTDPWGYNNQTWDFQLLVGEDGHGTQADIATAYYFYVELE